MNEIKKIHLGRQPFTISVDAHKALRAYLEAIEQQVGAQSEVHKEIELRMAELLTERGIKDDKVVLLEDVEFLKEQLGEPQDFKDDSEDATTDASDEQAVSRRLFRDTDNAMIAGVSSGLAAYFGIDAVIVRLIFVITLFWGGAGLLAYLILWLVVPEAKTNSDRLQMQGKAVTVDSLKEVVDRADVPAAADRASRVVGRIIEKLGNLTLTVLGVGFVIAAFATFLTVAVLTSYLVIHGARIGEEVIYPLGTKAAVSLVCAVVVGILIALSLLLIGLAMVKRKWLIPGWVAAAALGVFIVATSIGTAIGFDIAPQIRDKYQSMNHTQNQSVEAFTSLKLVGKDLTSFEYKPSSTYFVEVQYFGSEKRDLGITHQVKNGQLSVDATKYKPFGECNILCVYNDDTVRIIIHAPRIDSVQLDGTNTFFTSNAPMSQDQLQLIMSGHSSADIQSVAVKSIKATVQGSERNVVLQGLTPKPNGAESAFRSGFDGSISSDNVSENFELDSNATCDEYQPIVYLNDMPKQLVVGGETIDARSRLMDLRNANQSNAFNCVIVGENQTY